MRLDEGLHIFSVFQAEVSNKFQENFLGDASVLWILFQHEVLHDLTDLKGDGGCDPLWHVCYQPEEGEVCHSDVGARRTILRGCPFGDILRNDAAKGLHELGQREHFFTLEYLAEVSHQVAS